VLCGLLSERVPIRDLRNIIGALIESAAATQDPRGLLATIRVKLGGFIRQNVFGAVAELKVAALEPNLEKLLQEISRLPTGGVAVAIEPVLAGGFARQAHSWLPDSGLSLRLRHWSRARNCASPWPSCCAPRARGSGYSRGCA
jgi:flagellar biosynthesis component FlhA